ncbi:MAG: DUF3047 domain-containing protein [Nitrospiria bacterium]
MKYGKHLYHYLTGWVISFGLFGVLSASPSFALEETLHLLSGQMGENGLPSGWEPLTFKKIERHTQYRILQEEGRPVIRAISDRSASGLSRPLDLDPKVYPILSWCWKVDGIISKGDARKKNGDDYPARIYLTFKYDPDKAGFLERSKFSILKKLNKGKYPPKGALTYIWANRIPKGEAVPNAYTDRVRMVAVESGEGKVGQRLCEERNIYEDYLSLFGEAPPRLSGVAVMTDTDNTGETASASYSDLVLHRVTDGRSE